MTFSEQRRIFQERKFELAMNQNYKLLISYDGTRYHGWETKPDAEMTVEGKIEAVLERMAGAPVHVIGAGRTDAGVHARAMAANVHLDVAMDEEEIRSRLNRYLPDDICVLEVKKASERFHARYNSVGKTYRYSCYYGPLKPVFDRKYVCVLEQEPDMKRMKKAAEYLTGEHDFASFCGNTKMKKSTVRRIDSIEITKNGPYIYFTYQGDGFLYHMVRILTGTLLEVGFGRRSPESMTALLEARNRSEAGFLMPAQGLCLMDVRYF